MVHVQAGPNACEDLHSLPRPSRVDDIGSRNHPVLYLRQLLFHLLTNGGHVTNLNQVARAFGSFDERVGGEGRICVA